MRATEPYTIFLRELPSGNKVYYYQYRDCEGHRSAPRSTGCKTKSAALRYCQKLFNEGFFTEKNDKYSFEAFAKDFFSENGDFRTWKRANGKDLKPETVRRYQLSLETHIMPYFGKMPLKNITKDDCKRWVLWAGEKWSPKSVNNDQGVLNLIFEDALDKDIIKRNPLYKLGLRRKEKKARNLLSVDEIKRLYHTKWTNEQEKQAFLLAAITGMRIGEVVALRKKDVGPNYLDVYGNYSAHYGLQQTTKTGIKRYVPIPCGFCFPESASEWVFDGRNGQPIKAHAIYNAMTRRCDSLKIDRKERGIDVHSLRDFFVTYLRSKNVPDPKIRAVVGHADETMTDLYTHWKPEMFPEVYEIQEELYKTIIEGGE